MNNQTISTIAFIGAAGMIVAYLFKAVPVKTVVLAGGGLAILGFATQPQT
jgi:hypothetical protein